MLEALVYFFFILRRLKYKLCRLKDFLVAEVDAFLWPYHGKKSEYRRKIPTPRIEYGSDKEDFRALTTEPVVQLKFLSYKGFPRL